MEGDIKKRSRWIKTRALEQGFTACGFSIADRLTDEETPLKKWLEAGLNATMEYMKNHYEKRLDPRLLVDKSRSVISVLLPYFPAQTLPTSNHYTLSKYAYGKDYHEVMKKKLHLLMADIKEQIPAFEGRAFVDSAPVLEKAWAQKCGLGWIGKNSCLINKKHGSFHFIGEIISNLELLPDAPATTHCGNCKRCIDACPTKAIIAPGVIDARKCISYLTIESREALPENLKSNFKNSIFGCDICQDVCPYNRFSTPHQIPEFNPHPALFKMDPSKWQQLSRKDFNEYFRKSAVKRTKYDGFMRNIQFLSD